MLNDGEFFRVSQNSGRLKIFQCDLIWSASVSLRLTFDFQTLGVFAISAQNWLLHLNLLMFKLVSLLHCSGCQVQGSKCYRLRQQLY